jgi:hypothetical protein
MRGQLVQWQGDNVAEVERMLAGHLVRADKEGDLLKLTGIGISTEIKPGDSVVLERDRLGVRRAHDLTRRTKETWVTWQGNNLDKCKEFLKAYKVRFEVQGNKLGLFGDESPLPWFILKPGDRLVKRGGEIVISVEGRDHRAD